MQALNPDPSITESRGGWGWFVAFGVLLVILGFAALYNAIDATLVTTVIVGWALVIGGVVEIVGAFMSGSSLGGRILNIALGVLYILVGFDIIANPLEGVVALTVVVGLLLIIDGVIRLWAAFTRDLPNRWLIIIFGVINILFGLWVLTNIPVSGLVIGVYVGVMLLMAGFTWIVAGFSARSSPPAMGAPA